MARTTRPVTSVTRPEMRSGLISSSAASASPSSMSGASPFLPRVSSSHERGTRRRVLPSAFSIASSWRSRRASRRPTGGLDDAAAPAHLSSATSCRSTPAGQAGRPAGAARARAPADRRGCTRRVTAPDRAGWRPAPGWRCPRSGWGAAPGRDPRSARPCVGPAGWRRPCSPPHARRHPRRARDQDLGHLGHRRLAPLGQAPLVSRAGAPPRRPERGLAAQVGLGVGLRPAPSRPARARSAPPGQT